MTTFAKATALFQQRPARAASLSLLPGLGQLYNRRLDKAFAFFIVDVANLAFLSVLLGGKLLFNLNSEHWQSNLASWSYGTAPFFVIQTLLLTYIGYSVFDAYKDALLSEESGKKPELCLSHTTCASYILHLSALCAIFFVILFKITPHEMKPEQPQISLTFDLQSPTGEKRQTGQMTQNLPESFSAARIKDLPKENELNASSQSAELTAGQNKVLSLKDASQETQAISSKKIQTPDQTQSPRDVSSKGESEISEKYTNKKNDSISQSAKPNQRKEEVASTQATAASSLASAAASPATAGGATAAATVSNKMNSILAAALTAPHTHNEPDNSSLRELAQTAPLMKSAQGKSGEAENTNGTAGTGTGSGGDNYKVTDAASAMSVAIGSGSGSMVGGIGDASTNSGSLNRSGAGGNSSLNSGSNAYSDKGAVIGAVGTTDSKQTGPSILGFMDASLSADPDMRQVWSEMSGNISRKIKEQPLVGQGTVISTFVLNENGYPTNVAMSQEPSQLSASLKQTLANLPSVLPPVQQRNKVFFQVKASNETNGTFVSLEINSQATPITPDSLRDFKYQVTLQSYLKGIKKAIYSSWKPPVQDGIKPVMIGFKVNTDGTVSDQRIVQSSGDPRLDKAALNAGRSVTKWAQPPAGTMDDLDICMVLQKCKACEAGSVAVSGSGSGSGLPVTPYDDAGSVAGNGSH